MISAQQSFRLIAAGIALCFCIIAIVPATMPEENAPGFAPTPVASDLAMIKKVYAPGEVIPITLTIRNHDKNPLDVSGIPPEVTISIRKNGWEKGIVRRIPGGRDHSVIEPRTEKSWTVIWDQKDEHGMIVKPGVYYLTLNASGHYSYGEVIILPPEGVQIGTLSLDKQSTDYGITTEFQSLILDKEGSHISALIIPALRSGSRNPAPGFSQVSAEYRIDDGPAMNFRDFFIRSQGNDTYEITWQMSPVPCNAEKLQVSITKFDPYQGNWNASINLDSMTTCILANGTPYSRSNFSSSYGQMQTPVNQSPIFQMVPVLALVFYFLIFTKRKNRRL